MESGGEMTPACRNPSSGGRRRAGASGTGRGCGRGMAVIRRVVGFLESVLVGCFVSCFRIRDSGGERTGKGGSRDRNLTASTIQFGAAFEVEDQGERNEADYQCDRKRGGNFYDIDEEIKHEAKYLKTCGTILRTPAEIQKSAKRIALQYDNSEQDQITGVLEQKKGLEEHERSGVNSEIIEQPSPACMQQDHSCDTRANQEEGNEVLANQRSNDIPERNKQSLSLEMEFRSPGEKFHMGRTNGMRNSISLESPYPTPVLLTDDMQTPGTVYTAQRTTPKTGKHARIRTQFVYPVLKPIDNKRLYKSAQSDSQTRSLDSDSKENIPQVVPSPLAAEVSPKETELPVSSFSRWLKPSTARREQDNSQQNCKSIPRDAPDFDPFKAVRYGDIRTTELPEWWGGNGIPNTTTKYKEDQRVNWHATPFEVRLEKALMGDSMHQSDSMHHPRKVSSGRLICLESSEEDQNKAIA